MGGSFLLFGRHLLLNRPWGRCWYTTGSSVLPVIDGLLSNQFIVSGSSSPWRSIKTERMKKRSQTTYLKFSFHFTLNITADMKEKTGYEVLVGSVCSRWSMFRPKPAHIWKRRPLLACDCVTTTGLDTFALSFITFIEMGMATPPTKGPDFLVIHPHLVKKTKITAWFTFCFSLILNMILTASRISQLSDSLSPPEVKSGITGHAVPALAG